MFVVVVMIAASAVFHFAEKGIAVIGPVPGGLPPIGLPDVSWSETLALLPVAASCFVMIITQSAATSRVFAVRYRERVDENADILGLSVANAPCWRRLGGAAAAGRRRRFRFSSPPGFAGPAAHETLLFPQCD